MSELDDYLHVRVGEHVDAAYRTLDALHPLLMRAVEDLGDTLLGDRRLVACGLGTGSCHTGQGRAGSPGCHRQGTDTGAALVQRGD